MRKSASDLHDVDTVMEIYSMTNCLGSKELYALSRLLDHTLEQEGIEKPGEFLPQFYHVALRVSGEDLNSVLDLIRERLPCSDLNIKKEAWADTKKTVLAVGIKE